MNKTTQYMISSTEEDYLKAIFKLSEKTDSSINTNAIAAAMNTAAASVTDMLKRLADKELIHYARYKGVTLTEAGKKVSTLLVRKHRLWEVFLVEKLNFAWDEVHDIAEQLEHIRSEELVRRLDQYLQYPKFDPHGDPIPNENGEMAFRRQVLLSEMETLDEGVVVGVQEHSSAFLQHLNQLNLILGTNVQVLEKFEYDNSIKVLVNKKDEHLVSYKVSQNLFIKV